MRDSGDFLIRTLLAEGVVTPAEVERAQQTGQSQRRDPLDMLVAGGAVSARTLAIFRAKICEYPFVDLAQFDIDLRHASRIPRATAEKLGVFPLFCFDSGATVAMLDPLNLSAIDQVRQLLKCEVDPVICDAEQLGALITRAYSLVRTSGADAVVSVEDDKDTTSGDEPVVAAVNQIIMTAIELGASDIHLNPDDDALHLRYRVDGVMRTLHGPSKGMHAGLVQRLKVMSKLDVAQTRKPQDGKIRFAPATGDPVDIRLSLLPTIHGENAVMRLLRGGATIGRIEDLNMPDDVRKCYEDAITRPHGMILVTGPTGSGKTTTLYTALAEINCPERNIVTIEDPVEVRLPLVRQVQVNAEIGLTFATALRSILRQDPDVVLVGEIRDSETARIAVQAAMTGHLVFSTLHTNDAVGAVARLRDLDVPAFGINQGLLCVLAQRLVRKICSSCRQKTPTLSDVMDHVAVNPGDAQKFRYGAGCDACGQTGYRGRVGVYEIFRITPAAHKLIEQNASITDLRRLAASEGMRTMWDDGLAKAIKGQTTWQELMKLRTIIDIEEGESRAAA
ncbi:MAG: type II/IV secretion system protein [Phycisphaerales bacterium]|nr:type II/IV secretion system protein [Phycisphaerales bacterium]